PVSIDDRVSGSFHRIFSTACGSVSSGEGSGRRGRFSPAAGSRPRVVRWTELQVDCSILPFWRTVLHSGPNRMNTPRRWQNFARRGTGDDTGKRREGLALRDGG